MTSSIKGQILEAVKARLETVTEANGYDLTVKKVYFDTIPMGIQLRADQLPAIFLLDGPDTLEFQLGCLHGTWDLRLQLWHNEVGDVAMNEYVRAVLKAIYADSPTAERVDAFRSLHARVYEFIALSISPDLHMINANRIVELGFSVRYRTKLFDT